MESCKVLTAGNIQALKNELNHLANDREVLDRGLNRIKDRQTYVKQLLANAQFTSKHWNYFKVSK